MAAVRASLLRILACAAWPIMQGYALLDAPLQVHVMTIPAHGHYMTTKGAALALVERGHNVTWILCDRSRKDYDIDEMASRGLGFISAGPCPVYDQREGVLASVIRTEGGLPPNAHSISTGDGETGGLAATRAMFDGMTQLAFEMCEALMPYYAADPASRLPDVILFDADTYCAMDASVVWRVPRVARVGTGPRDPYSTPFRVPAYLSGRKAENNLAFRSQNALSLLVSRYVVSWWLLPRLYSKHRRHWLALYGEAGMKAAVVKSADADVGVALGVPAGTVCAPCPFRHAGQPCKCWDETWMPANLPWDGVPTMFNSHWGLEYPRSLRPYEHMIGHTNDFAGDSAVPLSEGLRTWLDSSGTPVVYVGLGTLSIMPVEWLEVFGLAMVSSRHFRFVWSVPSTQQHLLPQRVQLLAARSACASHPHASQEQQDACTWAEEIAAKHPQLTRRFKQLHEIAAATAVPGGMFLISWAPQVAVLTQPVVSVFITHGGMNGVAEGTYARKPMLCMPLFSDQPDNCARMEDRGFALTLTFPQLSRRAENEKRANRWPHGILDPQLFQLHAQGGYRAAVSSAWLQNVAAGGRDAAVRVVELSGRQPYGAHCASMPADAWLKWWEWMADGWDSEGTGMGAALVAATILLLRLVFGCCRCTFRRGTPCPSSRGTSYSQLVSSIRESSGVTDLAKKNE